MLIPASAYGGSGSDGWSGPQVTSDPVGTSIGPFSTAATYTYSIECTGPGGVTTDNRILTISPAAPPPPVSVNLVTSSTAVQTGQTASLSWTTANASSCNASGGTGSDSWAGSRATSSTATSIGPFSSAGTFTYTLSCSGAGGSSSGSVSIGVTDPTPAPGQPPPTDTPVPTVDITVQPGSIVAGNSATLSWTSGNVSSCDANGSWSGVQATSSSGVSTGQLNTAGTYSYGLTCTGAAGTVSDSVSLRVDPRPASVLSFSVADSNVQTGNGTSLSWSSSDATACTGTGGAGSDGWAAAQSANGSGVAIGPFSTAGTYAYTISCSGPGGASGAQSVTVNVTDPPPVPQRASVREYKASNNSVPSGGFTSLSWITDNATQCTASGGTGTDGWSGLVPVTHSGLSIGPLNLTGPTTYTLTCLGAGGASDPASLVIANAAAPTPPASVNTFGVSVAQILVGQSASLFWTSSNATSCTPSNGIAGDGWSGTLPTSSTGMSVGPVTTVGPHVYSLLCTGPGGASSLRSVTVTASAPAPAASILSFAAFPTSIIVGQSTVLNWATLNATSCTASGGTGTDGWSGSVATTSLATTVGPFTSAGTVSFTLNCLGAGGASGNSSVSVAVSPAPAGAPTISLHANGNNPAQINPGQTITLDWTTTNATVCTASGGTGSDGWPGVRTTSSAGVQRGRTRYLGHLYLHALLHRPRRQRHRHGDRHGAREHGHGLQHRVRRPPRWCHPPRR